LSALSGPVPKQQSDSNERSGLTDTLLLTAVEAIYDAAANPDLWPKALAAIADCTGDVGALLIWGRDDGSYGTIVSDGLAGPQSVYQAQWSSRDIRAIRATERGLFFRGEPFTDRHLVSEDEERTDPFYADFLLPHRLGRLASIAVSPDPHVGVALAVQRDAGAKPPYSDEELAILARIGPHIEKSLRLSIRLLDSELLKTSLGEALARVGIGVFALDSMGRVNFSNPAGERLLGDELEISQQRLRIGSGNDRDAFDTLIESTLRGEADDLLAEPKPIMLRRASSDSSLVLYLLPIRTPLRLTGQFLTHARALVLVIEPNGGEPADPAIVRDLLGLTLGEARVAALVGHGLNPRDTAQKLGIAEDTARNVLKRVFSKVGVSRQSELVALLTKLVLR
jgi:DNA-binding CsgD family transcriptional regulator/PAS domain-containing protein